jgi:hypothetical protein
MRSLVLYWDNNRCWCKGILQEYIDDKITREWFINYAYDIKDDFFYIYEAAGGSGYGFTKGELLAKISMIDSEYCTRFLTKEVEEQFNDRRFKKVNIS